MENRYEENDNFEQQPTSPNLPTASRLWNYNLPSITQIVVKDALRHYVSNHPTYKNVFLKQMHISNIITEGIYIYKLETMGEMREKGYSVRPYKGSSIDNDRNCKAPGIWDIPVRSNALFQDSVAILDIPHTECVKRCTKCSASGYIKCTHCKGSGSIYCSICENNGPLMWQGEVCYYCKRWGNEGLVACCDVCDGKRELKCTICDGYGFLIQNETVIVSWLNKVSEKAHKECAIPSMKLTEAVGEACLCEVTRNLRPMCMYPFISSLSKELLRKHRGAFPYILIQRHRLRVVPVSTVSYTWKGMNDEFFIYDSNNKIYFKQFPAKWTSCFFL